MDDGLLRFFGFAQPPFGAVDAPERIFRGESRAGLVEGVVKEVLTGPLVTSIRGGSGVGKTSLARLLAAELRTQQLIVAQLAGVSQTPLQVQRLIGEAAAVEGAAKMPPDQLLRTLRDKSATQRVVLLFDDADALPVSVFRYLQLLIELFDFGPVQLSIILIGEFGQWAGLDHPDLERLRNLTNSFNMIYSLRETEAAAYLDHKLRGAGRPLRDLMTKAAVVELLDHASGNPARLDALMEAALVHGHAAGRKRITLKRLRQAISDDLAVELQPARPLLRSAAVAAAMSVIVVAASVWLWRGSLGLEGAPGAERELAAVEGQPATLPPDGSLAEASMEPEAIAAPPDQAVTPPADAAIVEPVPGLADVAGDPTPPPPPMAVSSEPLQGPVPDAPALASLPTPPERLPPGGAPPDRAEAAGGPVTRDLLGTKPEHPLADPSAPPSSRHGGPGLVLVAQGEDSMRTLYARVYRGVTPPPFAAVLAANRVPVRPGAILVFPEPPEGWSAHGARAR